MALWCVVVLMGLSLQAPAAAEAAVGSQGVPGLNAEEAQARLALCQQMAREMNRKDLADEVRELAGRVKKLVMAGDSGRAENLMREMESKVGVDPGGWSMAGLKIFRPEADMLSSARRLEPKLARAMAANDAAAVAAVVKELEQVLGAQAGLPDARRRGSAARPQPATAARAAEVFARALVADRRTVSQISQGRPLPDQMLRVYAAMVEGACEIRPAMARQVPEDLAELDRLVAGGCQIMLDRQQPDGHFPFPDLRGKNIRFGEMTDRLLAAAPGAVSGGWVVAVTPDGGMQFDTGRCGSALLRAGALCTNATWLAAGRRAADWALTQPCVPNFNYNAFSVGLLARAYRILGDEKYLAGAWQKFSVGVAPGQTKNGRWIDAHNARTVYHVIILAALNELAESLPREQSGRKEVVAEAALLAAGALLDEFDAIGITATSALPELIRFEARSGVPNPRLRRAIELAASVVMDKCAAGDRAKFGVPPDELAVVARAWK